MLTRVPQKLLPQFANIQTTKYALNHVTALDGSPVLCVVILTGKKMELPKVSGVDWSAIDLNEQYDIKDGDEIKFWHENRGDGKLFPNGPVCSFKGRKHHLLWLCQKVGA